MKNITPIFKHLLFCWAVMSTLSVAAQVEYKVELKPDGSTYQIIMRSMTDLSGPLATTFTGQVTLVVPTGTFEVATKNDVNGNWGTLGQLGTISRQNDPQGLGFDYISFALQSTTTDIPYVDGEEVIFFEFTNAFSCSGDVFLMEEDDPYADNGVFNVGQQLTVFGSGPDNAWELNYDIGAGDCTADEDGDGYIRADDADDTNPCIPDVTAGTCDQDNDGLTNAEESSIGTSPTNPDTDEDGINDGDEVVANPNTSNPLDPCDPDDTDADNDGFCDTVDPDPNNPCIPEGIDADNDGVCDTVDPNSNNPCIPNVTAGACDQDNDGLTNAEEDVLGTNPTNRDTDGDGINDGEEVAANPNTSNPLDACDPNNTDSDNDGFCNNIDPDPLNPCIPDNTDTDNDGFCDNTDPDPNNPCIPDNTDADNDGVCDTVDPDDNNPCNPNVTAGTCDQDNDGLTNEEENTLGTSPTNPDTDDDGINDGDEVAANPNTSNPLDYCDPIIDPNNCVTRVTVAPKVFLQGAYNNGTMRDDLRAKGYLPTTEPYSGISTYQHVNGGGETTPTATFNVTGVNAIVDWVFVELRASNNPSNILASRSALLQRDGDVVDVDGFSALEFLLPSDNYFLSIRHRNHLGVMTRISVTLSETPVVIDFTSSTTQTWGQHAQHNQNGTMMLWGGNSNSDNRLIFQGADNENDVVLFNVMLAQNNTNLASNYINEGYHHADNTMDGRVVFQGNMNDLDALIFFNVLSHPANTSNNITYIVTEQVP